MRLDNLLLWGGQGFLGKHVAARARELGISTEIVGRDAADDDRIAAAEAIVYLASRSVPSSSEHSPLDEIDNNVRPAFDAFLKISQLNPSARIILISSGGTVYGHAEKVPTPEDAELRPISPYGLGKVMIERALLFIARTRGQPAAILRVANAVGRHQRDRRQGLVAAVMRSVTEGEPLKIYGDGSTVRDYVDADDVADAVLKAAGAWDLSSSPAAIWNVGSGVGRTVSDVIRLVSDELGRAPRVIWEPARDIDVPSTVLDVTRIAGDLGWHPQTSLAESIRKLTSAHQYAC